MAYTSRNFLRDLAIWSTGAAVGLKNTAKFTAYAAKKGISLAGIGIARAAPPAGVAARTAGTLAAANPISTGLGLGLGFTQTPTGQALLEAAAERGAADRVRAQQIYDQMIYENITRPAGIVQETLTDPGTQQMVKKAAKRKVSKYSRAVKLGMAAVKQSNYLGKKGVISKPKSAFSTVSKVASSMSKGKKRPTKGIRGTIARAIKGVLK